MTAVPHSPRADGGVTLAPAGQRLGELVEQAARAHAHMPFAVTGLPATALRGLARAELAGQTGLEARAPWVVAAHQAEFQHAGVWFKDAAALALAESLEARALHVVADLDVLKHGALALPRLEDDELAAVDTFALVEPDGPRCPAQLPAPTTERVKAALAWARPRIAWESLFDRWASAALSAARDAGTLGEWFVAGRLAVGAEADVALPHAYMSGLCRGAAFARFAADLALRHRALHVAHAEALAECRAAAGITDPTQPVPDLKRRGDSWELPLWAYRGRLPREPVYVSPAASGLRLHTPAGPLVDLPVEPQQAAGTLAGLSARDVLLAPRALTLTMFLRAFVADVFIHGLGGARYERAGDALTARWFGWSAPPFVTASATLRLPLPTTPATRQELARARWHAHHARHNPGLYARAKELSVAAEELTRRRAAALGAIARLPRLSQARAAAYQELHEVTAELRRVLGESAERPARQVRRIRRQLAYNAVAAGREYFFALMSRRQLAGLVEQARQWASGARAAPAAARRDEPGNAEGNT